MSESQKLSRALLDAKSVLTDTLYQMLVGVQKTPVLRPTDESMVVCTGLRTRRPVLTRAVLTPTGLVIDQCHYVIRVDKRWALGRGKRFVYTQGRVRAYDAPHEAKISVLQIAFNHGLVR